MYSEGNSAEEVLQRMKDNVQSGVDTDEGTFIHDSLIGVSEEKAYSYTLLDDVINRVFIEKAFEYGFSLEFEERCGEHGVWRKSGTKATGIVTFQGAIGTFIPKGTVVQTVTGLKFITTIDTTLQTETVNISCEALEVGENYNVNPSTIIELEMQILGIIGINNGLAFTGGVNRETDEELFKRVKFKLSTPATSGNEGHYKQWALEVDGIGDAVVIPTPDGVGGTVKVIAIDSNRRKPSQAILNNLTSYIESVRPLCATVFVEGATEIPINVSVNVQLATGATIEEVRVDVIAGLESYLKSIAFDKNVNLVRYTRAANILLDIPKIIDYFNLTVNLGTANIEIPTGSVVVLGVVTVNVN